MNQEQLAKQVRATEAYIGEFLDARPLPLNLREAIRYSLLGGGKRLRPVLALRSYEAISGESGIETDAMVPAAAIEMVHCFSLVHDDLPAMDDDDLRRGRPTLHKHCTEAMAILAGDAMTTLAFELVTTRLSPDPDVACALVHELSTATNNMIAGQVYDTMPEFDQTVEPIERLKTIHRCKTAALIRCSCRMGAIVAKADENQLEALTQYGEGIGLMFQVVDDLLDVTQTTEHLGKRAGKDEDAGKMTYPGLLGLDESKREVERLAQQAYDCLKPFGKQADGLGELIAYFAARTH